MAIGQYDCQVSRKTYCQPKTITRSSDHGEKYLNLNNPVSRIECRAIAMFDINHDWNSKESPTQN